MHDVLETFRLAAVRLHRQGVEVKTIAASFGVTTEAVYIWLKKKSPDAGHTIASSHDGIGARTSVKPRTIFHSDENALKTRHETKQVMKDIKKDSERVASFFFDK